VFLTYYHSSVPSLFNKEIDLIQNFSCFKFLFIPNLKYNRFIEDVVPGYIHETCNFPSFSSNFVKTPVAEIDELPSPVETATFSPLTCFKLYHLDLSGLIIILKLQFKNCSFVKPVISKIPPNFLILSSLLLPNVLAKNFSPVIPE
jgi:hypothetical protein